jgi:ribulose 1,5-bisphosphate synthetase/thiazole synthase
MPEKSPCRIGGTLSLPPPRDITRRLHSVAAGIPDTGESFDLLVVGSGLSGLGSAYYFARATGGKKRCLILENHPMFGGHCKQNEFLVNGQRLIGPQASNDFGIPREGSHNQMDELFTDLIRRLGPGPQAAAFPGR